MPRREGRISWAFLQEYAVKHGYALARAGTRNNWMQLSKDGSMVNCNGYNQAYRYIYEKEVRGRNNAKSSAAENC